MIRDEDIEAIDAFFEQDIHWDYLWTRVKRGLPNVAPAVAGAIQAAVGYMLRPNSEASEKSPYGPFPPIWESSDGVSAPVPREAPVEMKAIWSELAEKCTEPAARARFNDLLWVARHAPNPAARARAAVIAYDELAGSNWTAPQDDTQEDGSGLRSWGSYRRGTCLTRALQITRELNDNGLTASVSTRCVDSVEACIASGASIGTVFVFLRALVNLPRNHRPGRLVEIVESAKERYGTTAHNFESLGDLLVTLASSGSDRKDIRAEQLDHWIIQARANEGLARLVDLQKALEFARAHGLADRIDELRYELDHIDVSTLGFRSVSVSVEISRDEIAVYIADFVSPETWQESLARFGLAGGSPPSGDLEQNLELVEELSREAPLLSIVPTIIIDAAGRPIAHASDDDEKQALQLRRQEQTGIALWATTAVEILERVAAKYGVPTEEDLTAYFSGGVIPPAIAAKVAHAHVLYFTGAYDDCAHILVPRIEALIRGLCLLAAIPVAREAVGDDAGGVAPLGALLRELGSRGMDKSWARYLLNTLTEPTGLNLRNRISHGLLEEAGRTEAAILLHVANLLRLLELRPAEQQAAGEA